MCPDKIKSEFNIAITSTPPIDYEDVVIPTTVETGFACGHPCDSQKAAMPQKSEGTQIKANALSHNTAITYNEFSGNWLLETNPRALPLH